MSKTRAHVVVTKDGPYLVSGDVPLAKQTIVTDDEGGSEAWKESAPYKSQKSYALCRCGHSKSKPFCDGAHTRVGFDGTETASREPYLNEAKAIEGPTMVLTDAEHLCAFARSAIPTDRSGVRSNRPTIPPCGRISYVRSETAPPVVWSRGTRTRKSLSSPNCRFLSVLSKTRRRTAADRSGCAAAFPWCQPMGLNMRSATASRCAAAGSRKTSLSATARTRRRNSRIRNASAPSRARYVTGMLDCAHPQWREM